MLTQAGISWMTAIIILTAVGHVAAERPKGAIELAMVVEKEVVVTGNDGVPEVQRVPAAKVVPDDKVIYTIKYLNTGEDEAENIRITNPVPEHMHYLDSTATGDNAIVTFSVDGGTVFDVPEKLMVTAADGTSRKATVHDYTHIRWTLKNSIATREGGEVSFSAQLE